MANVFAKAEGKRIEVTNKQAKEIKKMYNEAAEEIADKIKKLENKENVSSIVKKKYLEELAAEISDSFNNIDTKTEKIIKDSMLDISIEVIENNRELLSKMGFSNELVSIAYLYVPNDVVKEIMSGKLYEGKWTLSSAIWKDNALKNKELEAMIAKGIAENKSTYEIAKDLEKYVKPSALKPWDWSRVYPNVRKVIDYNAQRLARTMVSHAYEESFVRATKKNPFIDAYKWLISNSDRVCPICIARSENDDYGMGAGIFPKDQLPLDHPNGMCTFETVMTHDYMEIAESLVNYYYGRGSTALNSAIDEFIEDMKSM